MENVEGLLLGEAWGYVQRIYKELMAAGYQLKHYLCKGERMGIPQARHRVFFIAFRNDIHFDFDDLDMFFDYEPVLYGDVKEGVGKPMREDSQRYKCLCQAIPNVDYSIADVLKRLGEKERCFTDKIIWDNEVLYTITAKCDLFRGTEKTGISDIDVIHCQTFPEDFNFLKGKVRYICGMSVPPVMIKRIVSRIIETGVFENQE